MNKFYFSLIKNTKAVIIFILLFLSKNSLIAQCSGGTSGGALSPVPAAAYQTMSIPAGNKYYTFVVAAATCYPTYDFSFCSTDGASAGFDTQLTILDNSGAYANGYDDDFCAPQSHITWTPTAAGTYRLLVNKYSCAATTVAATLAYKMTVVPNMTYVSATTAQASTATVQKCGVDQPILQIQVVTGGGTCTPISLTQLQIIMAGTSPTTDVSKIHIYYTGTSSTFAATSAFDGAGTNVAAGTITINGSQTLSFGTNYFWVAYDMNSAGTTGNVVDAMCVASPGTSLTAGGSARTVTANNPAGTRTIIACPVSPGGVASGLSLWLKANAGVTTSGVNVTGWTDQSTSPIAITVNGSPDYTNPGYNYNPYINFTLSAGNGGDYLHIPDTYFQSFFWVSQLTDLTRKSTHLATYDGVTTSLPCSLCPIHGGENGTNTPEYFESTYGSGNFQTAGMWRKNGDGTISYNNPHSGKFDIITALGGSAVPTNVFFGGQIDLPASPGPFWDARVRDWVGPVGEAIAYSGSITTAQANKVESYLAVKYGITLGGNGSTTLYYTSTTGTTIWSANTGYHYDVMGIGKEVTNEALDQPKSHSINTPADVVTFANSNFTTPTSVTNDGDYLLSGHQNGSLANPIDVAYTHNGPFTTLTDQLSRVWRTQKTGSPAGNLIMEFDMTLINGPTGYGTNANVSIRLLVDDNANFTDGSFGEHTYSPTAGYAVTGGKIYFTVPYTDIQSGTGYYTIGSIDGVASSLPIELTNFKVDCNNQKNTISWTTATETNNKFFTIERGRDAGNLTPIAQINGAGTSLVKNNYTYVDQSSPSGINYYRLKQTDFNGNYKYFGIAQSNCIAETTEAGVSAIYPNPTNGNLHVDINCAENSDVTIQLYDGIGRLILLEDKTLEKGKTTVTLNLEDLAKGLYSLRIMIGKDYNLTTKVIKN